MPSKCDESCDDPDREPLYVSESTNATGDASGIDTERNENDATRNQSLTPIIDEFGKYIVTIVGGGKPKDTVDRTIFNINQILKELKSNIDDCEEELGNVIETKTSKNQWRPNTVRTYLYSFMNFLKFVKSKHSDKYDSQKLSNTVKSIMTMRQYFQGISRKEQIMSRQSKSVAESNDEVTPADFNTYITSEHVKNMKKSIIEENPVTVVRGDHTSVRNFLIRNIVIRNPQRTASICNLLVSDVTEAKHKNGTYVILVDSHKTAKTYGSVEVVVSKELMDMLTKYLSTYSTQTTCPYFFVSYDGKQMAYSSIATSLMTELNKAGVDKK